MGEARGRFERESIRSNFELSIGVILKNYGIFHKSVISATFIPNENWYFKRAFTNPQKFRSLTMLQKLWNTCKKCGCHKTYDSEKLCESCKEKRREFWSDIKKIVGVGGAAFLVLIAGGKLTKKS